jgi:DNA-binding MarR family transcriptional regulator
VLKKHDMQARTIYLTKRVEVEVRTQMLKALSPYEITPLQYTLMSFVDVDGSNFSSAQLSRRFSMTPQSMNEIVAVLQRKMFLDKVIDPNHKRILRLNLTQKGKDMLMLCNQAINEVEENLFMGLNIEELAIYRTLMSKILANMHESRPEELKEK